MYLNSGCLHGPPCFFHLPCCWASRKPITCVQFKFVTRQVEASVAIRAAKLKFVAELGKKNSSSFCSTCCLNLQNCILLRDKLVANVVIRETMYFNLQCNNVARQVEENCYPHYRTFRGCAIITWKGVVGKSACGGGS